MGDRWAHPSKVGRVAAALASHHALVGERPGAAVEAEERGLVAALGGLPSPDAHDLDVLTMVDLAVGPSGQLMVDVERIAGISRRHGEDDLMHRAVTRSRRELLASPARDKAIVGPPDDWPLVADQGVSDAEPHGGVLLAHLAVVVDKAGGPCRCHVPEPQLVRRPKGLGAASCVAGCGQLLRSTG